MAWNIAYWNTFVSTFFLIPVLQRYIKSGHFTVAKKFKQAIYENLLYYGALGVLGGGLIIYLVVKTPINTWNSILGYGMTIANAYGLLLIIGFMGHGLVDVPRTLWKHSNPQEVLKEYEKEAPKIKDEIAESETELETLIAQVHSFSSVPDNDSLRPYLDKLLVKLPLISNNRSRNSSPTRTKEFNLSNLAALHRDIKYYGMHKSRADCQWRILEEKAFHVQDVLASSKDSSKIFKSTLKSASNNTLQKLEWWYFIKIKPYGFKLLAILCALLSAAIVLSEISLLIESVNLSIFYWMLNASNMKYSLIEVLTFLIIAYMSVCAYSSLMKMKFFRDYKLVKYHETDPGSLLFFTAYLCRLSVPLCYNFLNLVDDADQALTTQFASVMGKMDLLGKKFSIYVPVVMALVCVIVLFRLYEKMLRILRIEGFFYDTEDEEDELQDGRALLRQGNI